MGDSGFIRFSKGFLMTERLRIMISAENTDNF